MTPFDKIVLFLDTWFYLGWIGMVVLNSKDWDGLLGYKEDSK